MVDDYGYFNVLMEQLELATEANGGNPPDKLVISEEMFEMYEWLLAANHMTKWRYGDEKGRPLFRGIPLEVNASTEPAKPQEMDSTDKPEPKKRGYEWL